MITIHYPSLIILIGIEYVRCFMGLPPRSLRTNIALIKHNAEATKRQAVPSCAMIHGWWDLPRLVRSLPSTSPSWDRPNCEKWTRAMALGGSNMTHPWLNPTDHWNRIVNTIGPGEHTALTFELVNQRHDGLHGQAWWWFCSWWIGWTQQRLTTVVYNL